VKKLPLQQWNEVTQQGLEVWVSVAKWYNYRHVVPIANKISTIWSLKNASRLEKPRSQRFLA